MFGIVAYILIGVIFCTYLYEWTKDSPGDYPPPYDIVWLIPLLAYPLFFMLAFYVAIKRKKI